MLFTHSRRRINGRVELQTDYQTINWVHLFSGGTSVECYWDRFRTLPRCPRCWPLSPIGRDFVHYTVQDIKEDRASDSYPFGLMSVNLRDWSLSVSVRYRYLSVPYERDIWNLVSQDLNRIISLKLFSKTLEDIANCANELLSFRFSSSCIIVLLITHLLLILLIHVQSQSAISIITTTIKSKCQLK